MLEGVEAVVHSAASVNVHATDALETIRTNRRGTELVIGGAVASEEVVFLTAPRFVDLPRGKTTVDVKRLSPTKLYTSRIAAVFKGKGDKRISRLFSGATLAHIIALRYFSLIV